MRLVALLLFSLAAAPALAAGERLTWEQRFAKANAAHDGHLTQEEAKAAYPDVAKHFREIDTQGKGYVTENDVRAWRATRPPTRPGKAADNPLRPRPAFRVAPADQRPASKT